MKVLDLLSALGSLPISGEGSFNEAVQTIAGHENAFSQRRFLEGLGHARVERDDRRIHIHSPHLVALPCEQMGICVAVLSGARNEALVSELEYLASSYGASIERASLGDGFPARIALTGTGSALMGIAARCASLPVGISSDPSTPDAWRLLSSAPFLSSIIQAITGQATGFAPGEPPSTAEVFNPSTGYYDRWSRLRDVYPSYYALWRKEAYDYRLFWWRSEEAGGKWIQRLSALPVESYWLRWAAAYSAAPYRALPAITGDGFYKVRKVTPLPTELHRVCCLCSGYPPEEDDDFHVYRDVPPVIQQGVNNRLRVDNL